MELINGVTENLRAYSKLLGALDLRQQTLLQQSKLYVRPSQGQIYGGKTTSNVKGKGAALGPLQKSTTGQKKKQRSKGKSHKNQGLPPHMLPAPSQPRVKFKRGEVCVKQGILPLDTGKRVGDLRQHRSHRQQSSHKGAKNSTSSPMDRASKEKSRKQGGSGSHSSAQSTRTHQDPSPVAATSTSASALASSLGARAKDRSHHHQSSEARRLSKDSKRGRLVFVSLIK